LPGRFRQFVFSLRSAELFFDGIRIGPLAHFALTIAALNSGAGIRPLLPDRRDTAPTGTLSSLRPRLVQSKSFLFITTRLTTIEMLDRLGGVTLPLDDRELSVPQELSGRTTAAADLRPGCFRNVRCAQIAAIRGRRGDSQNSPWKSYIREERCAKSSRNRGELTRYPA
jgi:hypothetical protein